MKPHFIMGVGIPGSGKSTFLRQYGLTLDHTYLSTDAYIENEAALKGKTYNEVFAGFIKEADKDMRSKLEQAVKSRRSIIWDQTNLTIGSRRKKLANIPKEYYKIAMVFVTTPETIIQTNEERKKIGRAIPQTLLETMIGQFQMPTMEEGFDAVMVNTR